MLTATTAATTANTAVSTSPFTKPDTTAPSTAPRNAATAHTFSRSVSTDPRRQCARIEAMEVGTMVASEVPTATCIADRSEEHTSELQSLMRISYAVFCLKK